MEIEELQQFDRTYVEINLQAIRNNIIEERSKIGSKTKLMAIVKANAYGHGDLQVASAIDDLVDGYGVAMMEEALRLREHDFHKMILILGYTGKAWYPMLINKQISQAVYSYEMAKELNDVAVELGTKARVHIKIDTGMSRIGFLPVKDNIPVIRSIYEMPGIEVEGAFTHFAKADEDTPAFAKEPFAKYTIFVEALEAAGVHIPIKHVANSASIIHFQEAYLDMVRSGITTYGMYPSDKVPTQNIILQPALQWKSIVSFVKKIHAGVHIGYGETFTTERESMIATIPVGYADGYKRDLSNNGYVLIHGEKAPIVGRICMDQFMVDVTDIDSVKIGDIVTLIGSDGSEQISVEDIANRCHSFNYEFVCSISERVPRKYIK